MKEKRIDLRDPSQNNSEEGRRCMELCFKINNAMHMSDECVAPVRKLFCGDIGERSRVMPGMALASWVAYANYGFSYHFYGIFCCKTDPRSLFITTFASTTPLL